MWRPITGSVGTIRVPHLKLSVVPALKKYPHGAPVEVTVTLSNDNGPDSSVPSDLGLKGTSIRATVTDATGTTWTSAP